MTAVLDSRIRLPAWVPRKFAADLRRSFTHSNPDYYRRRSLGYATWGVSTVVSTADYEEVGGEKRLTLPRGGGRRLVEVAKAHGVRIRVLDRRVVAPVEFPPFRIPGGGELRWYQKVAVAEALRLQQGVVRAPTGAGKTYAALALIAEAGQRAIVIMRDRNLLQQWREVVERCLGLGDQDIGVIRGGRVYRSGRPLTLALQQSLYSKRGHALDSLLGGDPHGIVVVDECQTVAAKSFQLVVDRIPAKYRIGFSADETRKDKKEFLIYDVMGPVVYDVSRRDLETQGVVHPVTVRVVPTEFRADWYRGADPQDKDFGRLIDEMTEDPERNDLLATVVEGIVKGRETPSLVFSHRREHAKGIVAEMYRRGVECGLLLGGGGQSSKDFELSRAGLESGIVPVAAGTFNAIGQGIDLPVVRSGVCATPISKGNRQFFTQVRGRICRRSKGKDDAVLYYLWDREVFGRSMVDHIASWNDGRVEVLSGDRWEKWRS